MKWRKQPCDLRENDQVADYLDSFKDRHSAYGFFITLCDVIARSMDAERLLPTRSMPARSWQRACDVSASRWRANVERLTSARLVEVEYSDSKVSITVPMLADWADEYTKKVRRKSGHDTDNVSVEESRAEENRLEKIRTDESEKRATSDNISAFSVVEVSRPLTPSLKDWKRLKLADKVDLVIEEYPEFTNSNGTPDPGKLAQLIWTKDKAKGEPSSEFRASVLRCAVVNVTKNGGVWQTL